MRYQPNIWSQLKNISADELISALKRDGFILDVGKGSRQVFRHSDGRRVAIDYHPQKIFGKHLLKWLLDDIGWNTKDLRRLKLVR